MVVDACRMLEGFYSCSPAAAGRLQPNTDDRLSCVVESLPVMHTLPAVLFWSVVDIPLWFTAAGLCVYLAIVIAGIVTSLLWALLLS